MLARIRIGEEEIFGDLRQIGDELTFTGETTYRMRRPELIRISDSGIIIGGSVMSGPSGMPSHIDSVTWTITGMSNADV